MQRRPATFSFSLPACESRGFLAENLAVSGRIWPAALHKNGSPPPPLSFGAGLYPWDPSISPESHENRRRGSFLSIVFDLLNLNPASVRLESTPFGRWERTHYDCFRYIEDYDGGILMECKIDPKLPYIDLSTMIRRQRLSLDGISDIRDESDRSGMRIVIELKRGSEPSIVLNNLFRLTSLQSSFSCNMVGILNGQPKLMGLKELLQIRAQGRNTRGAAAMRLKGGDRMASIDIIPAAMRKDLERVSEAPRSNAKGSKGPWLLFISESGHGKRVPVSSFRAVIEIWDNFSRKHVISIGILE